MLLNEFITELMLFFFFKEYVFFYYENQAQKTC